MNKGNLRAVRGASCVLALALGLSGCGSMPVDGPDASVVTNPDSAVANTYVVIDLTPSVVEKLRGLTPPTVQAFGDLADSRPQRIGVGDTLAVSIWEAGAGGLFFAAATASPAVGQPAMTAPSSGARFVALPNQAVDQLGNITVPYAGQLMVSGLTPAEAQQAIERSLGKKALQPQAMVTVVQSQSNLVTVSGDVAQPGRLPLSLQGSHLLDVIAQAGGSKWPAYDTVVQLNRDGVNRRIRLSQVLDAPAENPLLQPGDLVHLIREPHTVAVLGATNANALVPFDTEHLSLAEALAKSGGLRDTQAEPKGVFVFRFVPVETVHALVPETASRELPPTTAVVFRADLRQPSAMFLSESFGMQDKDLVYVANTDSVQLDKLIQVARDTALILSPAYFFTR